MHDTAYVVNVGSSSILNSIEYHLTHTISLGYELVVTAQGGVCLSPQVYESELISA